VKQRGLRYAAQFLGSLFILSAVRSNGVKTLLLGLLWYATFGRLTRREWIAFGACCLLFTALDIGSTRHGVFTFLHPTWAGLPLYEFFMWGFFVLHAMRMLGGPPPLHSHLALVYVLLVLFATPFQVALRQDILFWATLGALLLALACFHEKMDFVYPCYMIVIGALWEYAGVRTHEWAYPGPPPGGVPLWFVTMWGGVGFFVRRLIFPLVYGGRADHPL
jgi:hypothetical protein